MADDPALLPWQTEIARHGIQAVSVFRSRLKGEVCGTLTIYADDQDVFQDKEIALLTEADADISFALDNLAHEDERRGAEEETLDRFTAVLDTTPDFVGMTDPQGRNLYLNRAARRMLGLSETADVTELSIAQCHPPEFARQILADGIPVALRAGSLGPARRLSCIVTAGKPRFRKSSSRTKTRRGVSSSFPRSGAI